MTPIELHILVGLHTGRRLLLEQATIMIGRAPENDIVLDVPYVSRRHAELRFEEGGWLLVNHSPNGVRLNRQWVTDAPQPIEGSAQIRIGDEPVLAVTPQAAVGAGDADAVDDPTADSSQTQPPGSGLSRRAKVWTGIGIYLVAMLGLIVFLSTLDSDGTSTASAIRAPELSTETIRERIHRMPDPQPPDERRARAALIEARELFNRRESDRTARAEALALYREAMAYMPSHELPQPIDRRHVRVLQEELTAEVAGQYQRAYGLLRSGRHQAAWEAFNDLLRVYGGEGDDVIVENIVTHAATARRLAED